MSSGPGVPSIASTCGAVKATSNSISEVPVGSSVKPGANAPVSGLMVTSPSETTCTASVVPTVAATTPLPSKQKC